MQMLEPTYLRYVYDGLLKGSFSSNNASALPHGFIGLFEEEFFPASMSSNDRNKLLKRLTLWALFKGSVSTEMASNILAEDINVSKTLIDRYSKWFNTPEPGKYILYHDRLKTYLLQKLSDHEVQELNEALIIFLVAALEQNDSSEAELYALDHLSTHMAVESELNNNYERLHNYVNREDIWQRQVKASKEYKWSQKGVQFAIKEGARRHHEMNTLTATVNSVKLMQEEQNSAKQILDLLKEGDYQTALVRVLSFDEEKQMTVYLLMIHELTLGDSKDTLVKVKACKLLLEIFQNKSHVFPDCPNIVIYKYHIELLRMNLDDRIFLDKFDFYGENIISLLENENIEIHEIVNNDIVSLFQKRSRSNEFISSLSFLFDRYFDINVENKFKKYAKADSYMQITINQQILSFLRYTIKIINQYDDGDYTFLSEHLPNLINIIINNDLVDWLYNEGLDIVLLGDVRKICIEYQSFTDCFAEILTALGKISDAIGLLEMRAQKSSEDNNYIEKNNYTFKNIAIYLFKKEKIKDALYFLERIEDNVYAPKFMLKGEAYLSFANNLIKKGNQNNAFEFIGKVNQIVFSLQEIELGRKTNFIEYFYNTNLHIGLYEIYVKIDKVPNALEHINHAISLNNIVNNTIFKENQISFRKKYQTLGKICKALFIRGYTNESSKIVEEFVANINSFKNKSDQSKSVDFMYSEMEGLYVNEFIILNEKYPLNGYVFFGKVLKYKKDLNQLELLENPTYSPSEEKDVKEKLNNIYNSNNYDLDKFIDEIKTNADKLIKILNKSEYERYLNKFIQLKNIDKLERFNLILLNTLKINRIQSERMDSKLIKKLIHTDLNIKEEVNVIDDIIQNTNESNDLLTNLNILIKNLEININKGSDDFNEIKEILSLSNKLVQEDKDEINLILIPILIKSKRLYLDFIYSLIEKMVSSQLKAKVYFKCAQLFIDDKEVALSMLNLSCRTLFEVLRKEDYEDITVEEIIVEDLIEVSHELINQNGIQAILEITHDFKDLFLIKNTKEKACWLTRAPITGRELPFDYIYEIYESICKKLINIEKFSEAFKIAKLMLEKNEIANIHFYYINILVDKGNINDAFKNIPKIIDLIDSSIPLPEDNSIWPIKGFSFLKLVDFYIKVSDFLNAKKFIDRALLEVFPINQKLSLEPYEIDSITGLTVDYKSHFNEENKFSFLLKVIKKLVEIGEPNEAINLLNQINPKASKYFIGREARLIGMQGFTTHFYKEALKDIAWYIFKKNHSTAFTMVFDNGNIDLSFKKDFYLSFFSEMDFEKNIIIWKPYFKNEIESFIDPISKSFIKKLESNSEYMYLSNFPEYTEKLGNILLAKFYEYVTSETKRDEQKLDLIAQVIDIDEWRNINGPVRSQTSPLNL